MIIWWHLPFVFTLFASYFVCRSIRDFAPLDFALALGATGLTIGVWSAALLLLMLP